MITREFLSSLNFRRFTDSDYQGFAGVQSPVPMIAETTEFLIILDGNYCEVYGEDSVPLETCENVSELPY